MATILRESFTAERFARIPEPDLVMDSAAAVEAFARAARPEGILSGVYAFLEEQASKMVRPGDRVLDLGCGPASLLASIAGRRPPADFVGIDLSPGMIAAGRRAVAAAGAANVELRVDDMTELASVEAGSVDVVLSSMALHHLPDTAALGRCLRAVERVMAPEGRLFVADFGRIKSLRSVEYFVARAIPPGEPILEHDYRASLKAAFSRRELDEALPERLRRHTGLYATVVSPMMMVLMTPFPDPPAADAAPPVARRLPRKRRADLRQLRLFLRLGGMPAS